LYIQVLKNMKETIGINNNKTVINTYALISASFRLPLQTLQAFAMYGAKVKKNKMNKIFSLYIFNA